MATVRNLFIDQGSIYRLPFVVNDITGSPLNLLGHTAIGRIKRSYSSVSYYDITVDITEPLSGIIVLTVPPTVSSSMRYGRYVYDVMIIDELDVPVRVLEGIVTINPAVSKTSETPEEIE